MRKTHQVFQAVFPAFHVGKHILLQVGHSTEFTVVVWWDRFAGAAVLPHILKTCNMVITGYTLKHKKVG